MKNKKLNCAVYTRVSTDSQSEVEFNSCDAQVVRIKSFISSQEDMDIYKVYTDEGYSGASLNRPALKNMIMDIQQGKINTIIAYKIDRLTRSPKDFYQLIEVFEKYDVSFISVTERFDTSTPSGRLLRNIMLTFAQFERELISERIRDKLREKARKGYWHSTTPFGYKRVDKKLVIEESDAKIVKRIFDLYIQTSSVNEIYKTLKSENVVNKKGKPFSLAQLSEMLKRVVYIGKVQYKDKVYPGIHAPIISEEVFEEAQKVVKRKIKKRKVVNHAIFPGLVCCKECGSIMSAAFTTKMTKGRPIRYFYYRCSAITKRDTSFCSTRYVSVDRLNAHIFENLRHVAQNTQYLESLIFTLNFQAQGRTKGVEMKDYKVENLQKIIQRIVSVSSLDSINEKTIIIKRHISIGGIFLPPPKKMPPAPWPE
jgi:DNA invertase Pin-like site-specific DNA recombinase